MVNPIEVVYDVAIKIGERIMYLSFKIVLIDE